MFWRKSNPTEEPEPPRKEKQKSDSRKITLGVNVETGEPVSFLRRILVHIFLRGRTRSGKSSLTIVSLIYQLLDVE